MPTPPISQTDARRRSKHAEFLFTAACTLRLYGRPELGDEVADLATKIADGTVEVDPAMTVSDR